MLCVSNSRWVIVLNGFNNHLQSLPVAPSVSAPFPMEFSTNSRDANTASGTSKCCSLRAATSAVNLWSAGWSRRWPPIGIPVASAANIVTRSWRMLDLSGISTRRCAMTVMLRRRRWEWASTCARSASKEEKLFFIKKKFLFCFLFQWPHWRSTAAFPRRSVSRLSL